MSENFLQSRFPNITPLRFFLALLVILMHVSEFSKNRGFPFFSDLSIFHKGTEAVYVFFTLSGFLIIGQLVNEKRLRGKINIKAFYFRRILRIFPLYYLVLIFGFLYYQWILPKLGFEYESNYNLLTGIILSGTFFSNIFLTYSPGGILEILWSLAIEEQFYLLFAPLILLLPIKRIVHFLVIFTIGYFVIYNLESFSILSKYNMLFFYFSIGGLCSVLINQVKFIYFLKKLRFVILALFVLYFTTSLFSDYLNSIAYHLVSMVIFALGISVLAIKPIALLENKIMNYLGKISYGIYMFHPIALQIVGFVYLKGFMNSKGNYTFKALCINITVIVLTILISHLSYKYYESYFLKKKYKNKA